MNTRIKLAASGLLVAALAATAVPVFAADSSNPSMKPAGSIAGRGHDGNRPHHGGPLATLVKAGTITQAQAVAVENALHSAADASRTSNLTNALAALVKAGTITQAQADAATTAAAAVKPAAPTPGTQRMQGKHEPRRGMGGALASWTQAQRDALHAKLEALRPDRAAVAKTTLASLVTAGTITQQQSDAIAAALAAAPFRGDADGPRGHGFGRHGDGPRGERMHLQNGSSATMPKTA